MTNIARVRLSSGDDLSIYLDGSILPVVESKEFDQIKLLYDRLANDGCPDGANRFVWAAYLLSQLEPKVTLLVEQSFDSGDVLTGE